MRKSGILFTCIFAILCSVLIFKSFKTATDSRTSDVAVEIEKDEEKEHEGYDEVFERAQLEFDKIKDPALGYVPMERMLNAIEYTENLKQRRAASRTTAALTWTERGPIFDVTGPSNGNIRAGNSYTSGRSKAILVDTLNDPSGNTVFVGGVAGGLWKCTNFLSTIPNWQPINDRFDNIAVSSLAQNPLNKAIMYFSTGEGASPSAAVYGGGVWKSVDAGATWVRLPSSTGFIRTFKIVCDASGNIYLANRNQTQPSSAASRASGLYRSKDGGATWEDITPIPILSTNNICTDIEISTTGTLHASFGYAPSSSTNRIEHVYTTDPANVINTTWSRSSGIRLSGAGAVRLELATKGNVVYGITVNASNTLDSTYKSINGGATFTKQNTAAPSTQILGSQGWIHITLAINPDNDAEIVVGGLDAYKSTNSGSTFPTRMTYWVGSTAPYVHADHMNMLWWKVGTESRMYIASDGGIFYSNNGGTAFTDKNRNLSIKQFYDGALHPAAGSNYMIAGSQDNGVHQLNGPGLTSSTEVTGGDGAFVHINQQNPQIQFGSYVYNDYRRSTNGGATWSPVTFSGSVGLFINPYDYDDAQNIMYASYGSNTILRWLDAHTSTNSNTLSLANLGTPTTFKVSPYTQDRVFIGSNTGKVYRLDNASTATSANVASNTSNITGATFSTGFVSCVNTGSSDNFLVATFSSYGVGHVWYSINGGTSWTNIDGNLPDMPVRWAVFDPQNNNRLFIATEAGVYSTDAVNGSSTTWVSDAGFPTVRTDMLQIRTSDNTIMATTFGRGVFTAVIPATPEVRFTSPFLNLTEAASGTAGCRNYKDYTVDVSLVAPATGDATVTYTIEAGNVARELIDFDYTTNGSFTGASKQHVFTSGATSTKTVTIRVYDDEEVETTEAFTLKMAVSGATDAFTGTYSTVRVTIKDNDIPPVAPAVGTGKVGAGDYGGYIQPFRGNFQKAKSQYIYLASELTAAGFAPGNINSLAFNIISKTSTSAFNGLTIALKATTTSTFSSVAFESGATPYYTGNYSTFVGTNTFAFSTPFVWDGTSNILLEVCYDNATIPGGTGDNVVSNTTPDVKGMWNRDVTGSGCSLPAQFNSVSGVFVRPDIFLNGNRVNNPPATALNTSKTTTFGMGTGDVHFYSATGNIIATIKSLSAHDYGCTEVKVDRAGTGATAFTNNVPANYLMDKTFQVIPNTNNTSGSYQITLYFTAAEKAGWEAATGSLWSNIKLVKVKSRISNYTPSTPQPDGPNAIEVVTPMFGTYGSDFTLTYTFSNGFSGFGAGTPDMSVLPVTLLDFQGRLDGSTALLNWSTSAEENSRDFDIEKSTDGTNYYKIGTVGAARMSSTRKDYSFLDRNLSPANYYRLRMNDMDGRNKLSRVVLIRVNSILQNVMVVNNPFRDQLNLRLAKEAAQMKVQLVNGGGAIVAQKTFTSASGQISWQLPAHISNGTYVLRTIVDGQLFVNKVIKQ